MLNAGTTPLIPESSFPLQEGSHWYFAAIASGVLVILIYLGWLLSSYPYNGLILRCCDGIVHDVELESPAFSYIALGDRLILINGKPLVAAVPLPREQWLEQPTVYTVIRDGIQSDVELQLIRPTQPELFSRLEPLFIAFGFWLIGLLAWILQPRSPIVRLFFCFVQLIALLLPIGNVVNLYISWAILFFNILSLFVPVLLFHFLSTFPLRLFDPLRLICLSTMYTCVTSGSLAYLWLIWGRSDFAGDYVLDPLRDGFIALVGFASIFLLTKQYRSAPLHIRQRRRLIVAGFLAAICPTLFLYFIPQLLTGTPLVSYLWTFPFALLLPLSFLYAIYAGELGRIDRVLNRSLVYTLLAMFLLSLYLVFFWASHRQLWVRYLWNNPLSNTGLAAMVALLYTPTRNHMQRWVDQLFYGGWYNYRTVVRNASRQLSQELDLEQLSQRLMEVMRTMHFHSAALLWPEAERLVPKAAYGYPDTTVQTLTLPMNADLMNLLGGAQLRVMRPGHLSQDWSKITLNPQERTFLASHEIKYWLPLINREALCGLLVMGERAGAERLDDEDEDVLATVAQQVTLAAENISLVAALRARLAEVERMRDEVAESQRRLADAREAERQHLSRELHDGPVQDLYSIQLQLQVLDAQLAGSSAGTTIHAVQSSLQQITATLRNMMNALRPPVLSAFGLTPAIRSHVEHLQQKHEDLTVQLSLMKDGALLPESMRLALFRIVQESLNNIVRHAQAQTVFITFRFDQQQIYLEIQDDGCGFCVPDRWIDFARQGHWGLLGMAERTEAIGGHLEVLSLPGAGTRLQVSVPHPPFGAIEENPNAPTL